MQALRLEDNQILLTTNEVAELCKATQRTIQGWIKSGKVKSVQSQSNRSRGGIVHMIPLECLDDDVQKRYFKKNKTLQLMKVPEDVRKPKLLDEYSYEERKVIQQWTDVIKLWQAYRVQYNGSFGDADKAWIEYNRHKYQKINLTLATLYRKWQAFKDKDYEGLIDKRGKWAKGKSTVPEVAWEAFKYLYLDENKLTIKKCYELTSIYLEKEMPELLDQVPSYDSFYRKEKEIPYAVKKLFREGNKAFEDDAMPYISRIMDDLDVNDVWVADGHTLDIMTMKDGTEKPHRLTVVSFMDAKSGLIVGWHITDSSSSQSVLYALRKGILKYGVPKIIYVDNGNEFLCFDIGGRGHRRRASSEDEHIPPGIFERLGITMWNALPRNARAKVLERSHKQYKEDFSRCIEGFCGGNIFEKPQDKLKKLLKDKKDLMFDSDLIKKFETYIEGWYNEQKSNGIGTRGRKRIEAYNEELPFITKRVATEDDLNLMLMRSSRMQTVNEKGVFVTIAGQKLFYWTNEFLLAYQKKQVYVRFDPENMNNVRVYSEDDVYQCTLPLDRDTNLPYGASADEIKTGMRKIRSFKKTTKEYNDTSIMDTLPPLSALELIMWKAEQNIQARAEMDKPEAKVIEPVRANESRIVNIRQEKVGIDELDRMIENARKEAM